jgi:hypothetical protein
MGHPHDPESHSHHNSVWISHNDVDGVSFWDDRANGRIIHRRLERFEDTDECASVLSLNEWMAETNKVALVERRLISVFNLAAGEWLLVIDLRLESPASPTTLGKTPFGLIGVRMAKTIGVHDGGGVIRNSEGGMNEAEVFWKRARWMDYSGPITPTAQEGITLMDHPVNPNHPSFFHVRNDGWMGASLTLEEPRSISREKPLCLRYGLYIHKGLPDKSSLEERWRLFSQTRLPDLSGKPMKP